MGMQNRACREEAACVFSPCNTPHFQSGLSLLFSQTQIVVTASSCVGFNRVSFQKLQLQEPRTTQVCKVQLAESGCIVALGVKENNAKKMGTSEEVI